MALLFLSKMFRLILYSSAKAITSLRVHPSLTMSGYSSTIFGINTRKYHGLLVAPLTPPARRHLILSKLDEVIEIDNKKYNLYSNMCNNYISEGFKHQTEFEKEYIPIFTYQIKDITIKKLICMEYGKNTVCIIYKIDNKGDNANLFYIQL